MAYILAPDIPAPGFSFDECITLRNAKLAEAGRCTLGATKTGTTIVGIIFADGVILGADTRSTDDEIVINKNCKKIHVLAANMYCCGAGFSADTDMCTRIIASQLELHRLNTGRIVPVVTANMLLKQMLFRYKGNIGAALVLGGVDNKGPHLYSIYPHGSTDKIPFATMGSGMLAAMAVFECQWKPNMTEEEGKLLVRNAVAAGIFNDLGSGSNIDLCVIRKGKVDYLRTYEEAPKKGQRQSSYKYAEGSTTVLTTTVTHLEDEREAEEASDAMDTSS